MISYNSIGGSSGAWVANFIEYYSRATNLFKCPTALKPPTMNGANGQGSADQLWLKPITVYVGGPSINFLGSLGFNGWFFSDKKGDGNGDPEKYFAKEASVQKPPLSPLFFDENWVDTWPLATDAPARNLYQGTTLNQHMDYQMGRITIARHGRITPAQAPRVVSAGAFLPGSVNMSFADGHAQTVRLQDLWTYYWHVNYRPPAVRPP